jgi:ketol-acid reductoisomerase
VLKVNRNAAKRFVYRSPELLRSFLMELYYDDQVDGSAVNGKRVVVVGYGSQGRAQALNLKDSGVNVQVAARKGKSADQARADGLEVIPLEKAAEADVLVFLLPDVAQPGFYEEHGVGKKEKEYKER